jgi:hypothetical protein
MLALLLTAYAAPANAQLPSYAYHDTQETIHGRIAALDGPNGLHVRDSRGFMSRVRLNSGTIITPQGQHLVVGMLVTVHGNNSGPYLDAAEVVTPYHSWYGGTSGAVASNYSYGYPAQTYVAPAYPAYPAYGYAYPYAYAPYGYGAGFGYYGHGWGISIGVGSGYYGYPYYGAYGYYGSPYYGGYGYYGHPYSYGYHGDYGSPHYYGYHGYYGGYAHPASIGGYRGWGGGAMHATGFGHFGR